MFYIGRVGGPGPDPKVDAVDFEEERALEETCADRDQGTSHLNDRLAFVLENGSDSSRSPVWCLIVQLVMLWVSVWSAVKSESSIECIEKASWLGLVSIS